MSEAFDADGERRLAEYLARVGDVLRNTKRRASFAIYAMGLLGDGERKSVEPIAARAAPDPEETDALHQRLCHFLVDAGWDDHAARRVAAEEVLAAWKECGIPVDAWIIDDTGFPKQGHHSVGVQRQYTGTLGKVANCQIGVSLSLATPFDHLPVDFDLYLPRSWTDDADRRKEAHIPDGVQFKTKPELALEQLRRAVAAGYPKAPVLGDAAYGNNSKFRRGVRALGLDYGLAVESSTMVWRTEAKTRVKGERLSVRDLALQAAYAPRGYRRITWRDATRKKLSARFAIRPVIPCRDDEHRPGPKPEVVWLVCEWQDGEAQPTKFYFVHVHGRMTKKRMVRLLKERWRTERGYEDLKGEIGFDHYEGRRFPGWHHHITVALCCYAFVTAERARRFPPTAGRQAGPRPHAIAA